MSAQRLVYEASYEKNAQHSCPLGVAVKRSSSTSPSCLSFRGILSKHICSSLMISVVMKVFWMHLL